MPRPLRSPVRDVFAAAVLLLLAAALLRVQSATELLATLLAAGVLALTLGVSLAARRASARRDAVRLPPA